MGGRRNKFERIYSESEHESSDEDSPKKMDCSEVNTNNSNLKTDKGKQESVQNDKFLITRSKRKYNKPELKTKVFKRVDLSDLGCKKRSLVNKDESNDREGIPVSSKTIDQQSPPTKKKRETIRSLDDKIQNANNFLLELNKKLESRNEEISKLKQVISSSRGKNEVEKALKVNIPETENISSEDDLPHDFPMIGYDENSDFEQFPEEFEEEEDDENDPKQSNSNFRGGEKKERRKEGSKKRRKSRSRSRSRSKRRRSKSRSRSRNRNDHDECKHVKHGRNDHDESKHVKHDDGLESYRNKPEIQNLVKKMVAEQMEEQKKRNLNETSGMDLHSPNIIKIPSKKSRSEATLYRPAVAMDLSGSPSPIELNSKFQCPILTTPVYNDSKFSNSYFPADSQNEGHKQQFSVDPEYIDNSLSKLRIISDERRRNTSTEERKQRNQIQDAREAAESAILQAERYKARIQQPNRGKILNSSQKLHSPQKLHKCEQDELRAMRYLDAEDDEFFHTTCHIDETIREKIEKGKFIELEKLIQKKILQYSNRDEGNRMQLINKDGISYFVPSVDKETRIDNIKKWEQAFRVYTTIYCNANPSRAGEILQYVDIIHRAAAIFNWDNVAKYDYVFRQLMAAKPHRSWAKVYTQMWNLTLNEPIKKFNEGSHTYNSNNNGNKNNNNQKKRDSTCWKYNKKSCSYGKSCKFEHKCSYCGVAGHPVLDCHKKNGKKEQY